MSDDVFVCDNCSKEFDSQADLDAHMDMENVPVLSDPDDRLDQLVRRSSVPNLASLFKAGMSRGLITPQADYGSKQA